MIGGRSEVLHCQPWSRLHFNFAGPMFNMYLVVVDAHTKWIEVFPMSKSTSFTTLQTPFAQMAFLRLWLQTMVRPSQVTNFVTLWTRTAYTTFIVHHTTGLQNSVSVLNSLNTEGISTPPFCYAGAVHN